MAITSGKLDKRRFSTDRRNEPIRRLTKVNDINFRIFRDNWDQLCSVKVSSSSHKVRRNRLRRCTVSNDTNSLASEITGTVPLAGVKFCTTECTDTGYIRVIRDVQQAESRDKDFCLDDLLFIRDETLRSYVVNLFGFIPLCGDDACPKYNVRVYLILQGEISPVCLYLRLIAMRVFPVWFQVGGERVEMYANIRRASLRMTIQLEDSVNEKRTGYLLSWVTS